MRKDMSQVLVERPRFGHQYSRDHSRYFRREARRKLNLLDENDQVCYDNKQSMKAFIRLNKPKLQCKELNENLRPLRRFLVSKLGQKWDDIYAEIMANLNLSNATQYHVWQHLIAFGEVQTKTYIEDGYTMIVDTCGPRTPGSEEFYVHPKTGLLCQAPKNKNTWKACLAKNKNYDHYVDPQNPLVQYWKINGVWYEYTLRNASVQETRQEVISFRSKRLQGFRKIFSLECVTEQEARLLYNLAKDKMKNYHFTNTLYNCAKQLFKGPLVPTSKRQLDSKEKKHIESLIARATH